MRRFRRRMAGRRNLKWRAAGRGRSFHHPAPPQRLGGLGPGGKEQCDAAVHLEHLVVRALATHQRRAPDRRHSHGGRKRVQAPNRVPSKRQATTASTAKAAIAASSAGAKAGGSTIARLVATATRKRDQVIGVQRQVGDVLLRDRDCANDDDQRGGHRRATRIRRSELGAALAVCAAAARTFGGDKASSRRSRRLTASAQWPRPPPDATGVASGQPLSGEAKR